MRRRGCGAQSPGRDVQRPEVRRRLFCFKLSALHRQQTNSRSVRRSRCAAAGRCPPAPTVQAAAASEKAVRRMAPRPSQDARLMGPAVVPKRANSVPSSPAQRRCMPGSLLISDGACCTVGTVVLSCIPRSTHPIVRCMQPATHRVARPPALQIERCKRRKLYAAYSYWMLPVACSLLRVQHACSRSSIFRRSCL